MSWKDDFPKENRYFETENGILYNGDVLEILKQLLDESIDTVITSPPYWGLRFYGNESNTIWGGDKNCNHEFVNEKVSVILSMSDKSKLCGGKGANPKQQSLDGEYITGYCRKCGAWYGQLGLEPNFQEYLEHLWIIFDEIYRILKPEGTLWVNLGDTYFSKTKGSGGRNSPMSKRKGTDYKEKSLCLIPERFAIGMIERGWILRNQIIWYKPGAMPESVKDRFTVDFEKIFFFVKQKKYYFEQQFEPFSEKTFERIKYAYNTYKGDIQGKVKSTGQQKFADNVKQGKLKGRNKRTVWKIITNKFKFAHVAVFPTEIPEICIKAGCPNEGIVLDPFMGSGTTAVVAEQLGRRWIGIEINTEYCKLTQVRIENTMPLFNINMRIEREKREDEVGDE